MLSKVSWQRGVVEEPTRAGVGLGLGGLLGLWVRAERNTGTDLEFVHVTSQHVHLT